MTSSHTVAAAATSLAAFCAANSSACVLVPQAVAALGLWLAKMKERQRGLNPGGCCGEGRASCQDRPNEYAHAFETKQTMGVLFGRLPPIWAHPCVGAATVWRRSRCARSLLLLSLENKRTRKSRRIDSPCAGTQVHKKEFTPLLIVFELDTATAFRQFLDFTLNSAADLGVSTRAALHWSRIGVMMTQHHGTGLFFTCS